MKKILLLLLILINTSLLAQNITATIPYQGYDETEALLGQGAFEVFLDTDTQILDKPIFLIDGFDPGNATNTTNLYQLLNFEGGNLGDILRSEGYDIVILDFLTYTTNNVTINGGVDFIQRNAMVLVELINQINSQKVGDEELVIIGPSMGGLVSRYALSYMEQQSISHETRLYISFDAPHLGANTPIGLQYFLNDLAEEFTNMPAQLIVQNILNSAASKEILVDHYLGHLLEGSTFEQDPTQLLPEGAPDFRDAFQAELDALGFPQQVRNVSIVNGSDEGVNTGTPGTEIINATLNILDGVDSNIQLNFTPAASQTIEVTRFQNFFGPVPVTTFTADASSPATSDGIDSAPGGTSSIANSIGPIGGSPEIDMFLENIEQDAFCFVPTISALAIENETDWHAIIDTNGAQTTPFVNIFSQEMNEPHLTFTPANIAFALAEIREEPLAVDPSIFEDAISLTKNPVDQVISASINTAIIQDGLQLAIYNNLGQLVLSKQIESGVAYIEIPHTLSSGMYVSHFKANRNNKVLKLVVK